MHVHMRSVCPTQRLPIGRPLSTPLVQRRPCVRACAAKLPRPNVEKYSPQLRAALDELDRLNSEDPRQVKVDGVEVPYELVFSRWMTRFVTELTEDGNPPLTEEVLIAANGQHVRRWVIPRNTYPEGKAAYFKWREDLKQLHAKITGDVMRSVGYPEESASKVESLIRKERLKEPEGQVVEDALCLCFLEYQLPEFRLKETREKTVDILRKTWARKMGEKGRAAALKLPLKPEEGSLVAEALGE